MKTAIIGGGAIGLLFASYLNRNHETILLCRREEQVKDLQRYGLTIETKLSKEKQKTYATVNWKELADADLIIIAVKQYDIQSILHTITEEVDDHIPVMFLQNGMSHLRLLDKFASKHILIGSVEHGVNKINDHHIEVNGIGKTNLACYRGNDDIIKQLLSIEDFPFDYVNDYEHVLQRKLLVNAIINPLTALYQVKNGDLLFNPYYRICINQLFAEIIECFPKLNHMQISDIEQICKITKNNQSSMLKDILKGKKTEIDAILGYIIGIAKENKKQVPLTMFLYESIKGMEH